MDAAEILDGLKQAGVEPQVVNGMQLAFPAGRLTDAQRDAIRAHKVEIIALLTRPPERLAAKGMTQDRAKRITKMLAARDATLDDRRSCAECVSYYAGRCLKRMQPIGDCDDIADVLHRCAGFASAPPATPPG